VSDDGVFYYVMELLDGIDLHDLVERHGPVPPGRAIHFLMQACDSLGEAHALGLVHRDIKPSNILACRMGLRCDFVKVLDFGLVKRDSRRGDDETHLSNAGTVSGTPAFMSPEYISGAATVSAASDIYALGCVAYWLLTGRNVFTAPNATMMMLQHLQNVPVPPSHRSPVPVPPEFESIVMRCLSKIPDERPADASALLTMLRELDGRPEWTDRDASDWWSANREEPQASVA
jgi:serine/threonine-protein kinase